MENLRDKEPEGNIAKSVRTAAFHRIVTSGAFIVPEISDDTGFSVTTVSKYVSQMVSDVSIEILDKVRNSKRGRWPTQYGVKRGSRYFVSIEVKVSELLFGLMDLSGKMIAFDSVGFHYENSFAKIEEICNKLDTFIRANENLEKADIAGICVSLGGRVNGKEGTSASIFNLEEIGGTTLAAYFTDRFGVKTCIENDTKAMAYGEYNSLPDKSLKDILFVNISWGLGLGIVIDGKIYNGKDGYSGEFGHSPMYDNDLICHCGKKGCLETEVSGSAIHRNLIKRIKNNESSSLSAKCLRGGRILLSEIIKSANEEDPLCIDLITKTGSELGRHLSTLINIFNPECIILGGELSAAASYYFLYPIQASVRKYSLRLMSQNLPILTSRLGMKAGIVGGCLIARSRYFMNGSY